MAECLILLGANLGDRRRALERALAGLRALPRTRVVAVSRVYETAPVGPGREPYLNAAARLRTGLSPMGLLVECKRLEAAAGRKSGRRWASRPLDVDLVDWKGITLRTYWLTLPHPAMAGRTFALAPLRDVAPRWKLRGRAIAALLARLKPDPGTVKIYR